MRLEHLMRAVFHEPWFVLPSTHQTIAAMMLAKYNAAIAGKPLGAQAEVSGDAERAERAPGMDVCGNEIEVEQMELRDWGALIPVGGVIGRKLGSMERGAGVVDIEDITRDIEAAEADESVAKIGFLFDTPGGIVTGVPEAAELIRQISKPTAAFIQGVGASSGYFLASACDDVFCTISSLVGSVGVYSIFLDQSSALAAMGLKPEAFASGELKLAGHPMLSLTNAQRIELQRRNDEAAKMFFDHVREMRGELKPEVFDGGVWRGEGALDLGLVDAVLTGFSQFEDVMRGNI